MVQERLIRQCDHHQLWFKMVGWLVGWLVLFSDIITLIFSCSIIAVLQIRFYNKWQIIISVEGI